MSSQNPVLDFLVLLDRHRNGIAEELNRKNEELHCLDRVLDQIDKRLPGVVKTMNGALRRRLTFQLLRQALTDARQAPKGTGLTYDVDVLPSQHDKVNVGEYMSLLEDEMKALDDQLWEHPLMVAAHWVNDKTTKELCLEEILDTAARYTGSAFALASRKQRIRPDSVEVIGDRLVEGRWVISVVPFAPEVIAEELRDLTGVPEILRALDYGELERHVCGLFPWIRDLEGYAPPDAEPPQVEPPDELLADLTKQQRRMVEYVWEKKAVARHKFEAHVWAAGLPEKKTVERQVQRLDDRFIELKEPHSISINDEFVEFDRGSSK